MLRYLLLLCVLLASLHSSSAALDDTFLPLSLEEAIQLADRESAPTRAAAERVRATNAQISAAATQPNPVLAVAQPFGSSATGGFDEGLLLSQAIEFGGKLRYRVRAARAERDAAIADQVSARIARTFAVQSAYFESLRADAETALAVDAEAAAQRFADAAAVQFQAGDAPRSNVVRSQIELSRTQADLLAAQTEHANRYATLRSLLNLSEATALRLTDSLSPVQAQSFALANLTALALENRPDVVAARRLAQARTAAVGEAKAQRLPDLLVEGRRATLDPGKNDLSVRFGVVLPLLDYGRIRADVNSAQAGAREQEALAREAERVVRLEVESAFNEREQARTLVESFQNGRLKQAGEIREMVQIGYANGANSYLEVIDAQQVYRTEQTDYARALAALRIATANLQRAVGGTLP